MARKTPTALTLAGLDPSGGAGIAADLRAFQAAEVWGAAVCACLTVQSTQGLREVSAVRSSLVVAQAREVLVDADVRAIKTGAMGSAANARAVAALIREHPRIPAIVDPVMIPTRGRARLDGKDGKGSSRALLALIGAATLVTPNMAEAAAIAGGTIASEAQAMEAARAIVALGARAVLVKGGHGKGREAVDVLAMDGHMIRVAGPRRKTGEIHGTGCTLASLIAGKLAARGRARVDVALMEEAVRWAKRAIDEAIQHPMRVGKGLLVMRVGEAGFVARARAARRARTPR